MKNIHLIRTEERSRLFKHGDRLDIYPKKLIPKSQGLCINQFIYITNEESIDKRNWFYVPNQMMGYQHVSNEWFDNLNSIRAKKIILTNDPKLIADGVQELTEEQLQDIVYKYPLDYVEVKRVRKEYVDEQDAYGYDVDYYSLFFNSFSAEKIDKIQETVNYFQKNKPNNNELEESIRQVFKDETKNKLWAEIEDNDCGFSEEYVFWLEQKLIDYAKG